MAQPIRLATFNIQHARRPDGEVDLELLARSCASLETDVLALQEVDVHLGRTGDVDQPAVIAERCGMHVVFGEAIAVRGGRFGNVLLSRAPIVDVDVVPLPSPEGEPRSAVVARTIDVSVAATHLGLHGVARQQLPVLVERLRARPGPRVVLGDLNLDAVDVVADGFVRVDSDPTWPAKAPRRTIDHVLLDGLDAVSVSVVHLPVSDHRALVVEVSVP